MNTTTNLLKKVFHYYQEQCKLIICLLPFCILMLVLLPKPARAGECACYTFGLLVEDCFETETLEKCKL